MRILILGMGAVGGYLGARMLEAGANVDFLVRPQRRGADRQTSLIVHSALGDIHEQATLIDSSELEPCYDLIILACKAFDLHSACDAICPAVTGETRILPLLNGLAHLDTLDDQFGRKCVMAGFAHLAVERRKDGSIEHLNKFHRVVYGIRDDNQRAAAEQLQTVFKTTKLETHLEEPIIQPLWDKFIFLTTLAGATCLFRGSVAEILATVDGENFILGLLDECIAIANASGQPPAAATLSEYRALLTDHNATYTASMLRNMRNNEPTEADHILGDMLERAETHRLEPPRLKLAYSNLQVYERQRANKKQN